MAHRHSALRTIATGGIWALAIVAGAMANSADARTAKPARVDAPVMMVSDAVAAASAAAFAAHPEGPDLPADKALVLSGDNALAPTIEVLQPKIDMPAHPPFDVRVVAHPHEGAEIDRASIRIRYGFFRLDITRLMLTMGHWQGDEFVISHLSAPAGTHWFYINIADTAHHAGTAAVKMVVNPE